MRFNVWPGFLLLWAASFLVSVSVAALAGAVVDLNRASRAELESLPGIGPAKAEAILAYRTQHGPFRRIEDLQRVSGFGPATVNRLRPDLRVGPAPVVSRPVSPPPVVTKPGQK